MKNINVIYSIIFTTCNIESYDSCTTYKYNEGIIVQNKFNKIVREICGYYFRRGKSMKKIAEESEINLRTLQNWKNKCCLPRKDSYELLIKFLKANQGEHFLLQLNDALLPTAECSSNEILRKGKFPEWLNEEDICMIKDTFPNYYAFTMICAMVVFGNYPDALDAVLPDGSLSEKASLVAQYENAMKKSSEVFGIEGIYDWKDKVIRYIRPVDINSGSTGIESIGQTALDNIIACYLIKNGKTNLLVTGIGGKYEST